MNRDPTPGIADYGTPGMADYGYLLALATLWGGSFMLIKLAVDEVPPATMTAARLFIGAGLLFCVALVAGQRLAVGGRTLALIVLVGIVGNALPFGLISWGEEVVDAGLASILMGIMPIATLVMAHFFSPGETLTARKLIGVLIGFSGLVVLVGPALLGELGSDGIRQLGILGAAICYGVSAILTRRLIGLPRFALGTAILMAGGLSIAPVALVFDRPWALDPDAASIAAVAALGVLPTGLAALLVFQILQRQGAAFFGQVNFLVPLMGVFWAILVLGEMPGVPAWMALALILFGIAVARGRIRAVPSSAVPSTATPSTQHAAGGFALASSNSKAKETTPP